MLIVRTDGTAVSENGIMIIEHARKLPIHSESETTSG